MLIGVGKDGGVGDRQTLFFAARRLVEALALDRPTVLVFDDIHVSASSMLDLLETACVAGARRSPHAPDARASRALRRAAHVGRRPPRVCRTSTRASRRGSPRGARQAPARRGRCRCENCRRARGESGREPALHRGAGDALVEGRSSAGELPSSDSRDHRREARHAASGRARGGARRVGVRQGLLVRSPDEQRRRPPGQTRSARLTRGSRPDPARSRLTPAGRAAIRVQAPAHPRGGIFDPAAGRCARNGIRAIALFLEEAASESRRRRACARAPLAGGRRAGAGGRIPRSSGADQANRGWAKDEAFRLYSEALELVPEDAPERRREIGKRLAVVAPGRLPQPSTPSVSSGTRGRNRSPARAGSLRA